jgi:hypothetical protein
MKFNKMTDEQKKRVLIAMYFLHKGAHQISRLENEFSKTDSEEEIKEARDKRLNLFSSIARINDMYLYSEDEIEDAEIEKIEDNDTGL